MENQVMLTGHSTETGWKNTVKSRFSKAASLFSGAVMLLTMMVASKSEATPIPTTSLTCTQSLTATSSCVVGYYASGWTTGTGYWTYTANTVGYTGITMTFNNQRSGTGPTTAAVYYNIGGSDVLVTAFTVNSSCTSQTVTLPSACNNQPALQVKFKMSGATNSGGTHRMPSNGGFDGTSTGCSTVSAGTISASASSFCGSGSAVLTLSGATSGSGITYLWESSTDGVTFSPISGATNVSYTTPTLTSTLYYHAIVTCTTSSTSATTATQTITVSPIPTVAPITGASSAALVIGATEALSDATAGGFWSSSNSSVASVDPLSGVVTANYGGTAIISYQVSSGSCANTATTTVNVVWPNTLALYAGINGNSTNVIAGKANETVSALTATGFGTATACSAGGFSGITVPATVTAYASTNPHIGYVIRPDANFTGNAFRIHAITRESSTGPTEARIAYRVATGGAGWGAWVAEANDVAQSTGASCGTNSNSWDFAPGLTITGFDSMEVAVFPFAPGASTGTFQLNSLEVYGAISNDIACSGLGFAVDTVSPYVVNICDSGSYFLTYNGAYTGVNGVGITYQWYNDAGLIPGATNASYNTGMLSAYPSNQTLHYYVVASCTLGGSITSVANTVNVTQRPTAGTITNLPSYTILGNTYNKYLVVGTSQTLGTTGATPGGTIWWSSNDTSATSIDSASGLATGNLPGASVITVHNVVNGCSATAKDSIFTVLDNTLAAYTGLYGTSTAVTNFVPAKISVTPLSQTGFTVATPCGFGGLSGLTTNATGYSAAGPVAFFNLTYNGINTQDLYFTATVRKSGNGPNDLTMAYSFDNGATWIPETINHTVEQDGCGYSTVLKVYGEINGDAPATVSTGDNILFGLFAYNAGTTSGTFQVNTIDIVGDASALKQATNNTVAGIATASDVQIYPNPASTTLNVAANEVVNVSVMSVDGKILIQQKDAKQINVRNLASGIYIIKILNNENKVIKTTRFSKL